METQFSGRILSFLSRFLPLMEKSGLNLPGQFNTQRVTKYQTVIFIENRYYFCNLGRDRIYGSVSNTR